MRRRVIRLAVPLSRLRDQLMSKERVGIFPEQLSPHPKPCGQLVLGDSGLREKASDELHHATAKHERNDRNSLRVDISRKIACRMLDPGRTHDPASFHDEQMIIRRSAIFSNGALQFALSDTRPTADRLPQRATNRMVGDFIRAGLGLVYHRDAEERGADQRPDDD